MIYLVMKKMKGVILAAGEGSRIRSVTYGAFPKELLPIGNVPTIRFPLEALRLVNVRSILVVIAPQTKHGIIDGLRSGRQFNVDINYAIQEKNKGLPTGIGAAILAAKRWTNKEEFVVALGDTIICDFSVTNPMDCLMPSLDVHRKTRSIATVLVHPITSNPGRFGVVKFRNYREEEGTMFGEVERMIEKPIAKQAKTLKANGYYYIIAGYYVFTPKIFSYIERTKPGAKNEIQITDAMELAIEAGEKVHAVVHAKSHEGHLIPREYWDVGIPSDYKEANTRLTHENIDKWLESGE